MSDQKFNIGITSGGVSGNNGSVPAATAIAAEALAFATAIRSAGEAFQGLLNSVEALGGGRSGAGADALNHRTETARAGPVVRARQAGGRAAAMREKAKQGTRRAAGEEGKESQEADGDQGGPGFARGVVSRLQHGFERLAVGLKRLTGSAGMAGSAKVPVTGMPDQSGVPMVTVEAGGTAEHGRRRTPSPPPPQELEQGQGQGQKRERKPRQKRRHFRHRHGDSPREPSAMKDTGPEPSEGRRSHREFKGETGENRVGGPSSARRESGNRSGDNGTGKGTPAAPASAPPHPGGADRAPGAVGAASRLEERLNRRPGTVPSAPAHYSSSSSSPAGGGGGGGGGGGEARLHGLRQAGEALKDGGAGVEFQKLLEALRAIENAVMAMRSEDRRELRRVRQEAELSADRMRKARQ